jgi:hypothetical protein
VPTHYEKTSAPRSPCVGLCGLSRQRNRSRAGLRGCPGYSALATGDSRGSYVTGDSANDVLAVAVDPNVHIGEYKALTCDVRPGRRPRGPALEALVADYRRRAGVST